MAVMAVVLVAIVGMLAFVIDLGFQMEARRELQNAADAGALAGVALLPDDQAGSIRQAKTFAYQGANAAVTDRICGPAVSPLPDSGATAPAGHPNVYAKATPGQKVVTPTGGNIYTLTVTMECTTDFSFGRILGLNQAPIRASATAAKGSPKYVSCPFPMALYDANGNASDGLQDSFGQTYQVGQYYPMYLKGDSGSTSNTGLLAAGSGTNPGGNPIRDAISGNCDAPIVYDSGCAPGEQTCAFTAQGVKGGPVAQGLTNPSTRYPDGRMDACGSGPYCPGQPLAAALNNISLPGGGSISMSAEYSCAQKFSDVVNPDGTLKNGQANSPCLATVPITSTYVNMATPNADIPVEGYATVFLAGYVSGGNQPVLAVQFVKNFEVQADIAAYNPLGSFVIRLIG
jgi:hypothetical protein